MDILGHTIIAWLEEDDTHRVLFRVRPLMTLHGALAAEDLSEYGLEGYLRVAPDRQEQHSFKDRMRTLGSLCLIDLSDPQNLLGKVRPNKNYAPSRGENNRYIIYSDAVRALPEDLLYEVVLGDKGPLPLTRQYYLRSGGHIAGPYQMSEDGSASLAGSSQHSLPPDCERLFLVDLPDQASRMFYWPLPAQDAGERQAAIAKAPLAQPVEEAPPVPEGLFQEAALTLHSALMDRGYACSVDQALHLLILLVLSPRVQLVGDCYADAQLAAKTIARLLPQGSTAIERSSQNWDQKPRLRLIPWDAYQAPEYNMQRYLVNPWPLFVIHSSLGWPQEPLSNLAVPLMALEDELHLRREALSPALKARLQSLFARLHKQGHALPLLMRGRLVSLACKAGWLLPGGQEEALGFALRAWAHPWLIKHGLSAKKADDALDF